MLVAGFCRSSSSQYHCVVGGHGAGEPEELTDELMGAVARLMRRG
jgi:hypothetical protein